MEAHRVGQRDFNPLAWRKLGSGRQEHAEEPDKERRPDHFMEGLRRRDARLHSLGTGEFRGQTSDEHHRRRDDDHGQLVLPVQIELADAEPNQSAHNETKRPIGMHQIEPGRFFLGIQRGRQRIDDCLHQAPSYPGN